LLATCLGEGKVFMNSSGDKEIKTLFATCLGAGRVLWIVLEIRQ
jgi:hypothetical protein